MQSGFWRRLVEKGNSSEPARPMNYLKMALRWIDVPGALAGCGTVPKESASDGPWNLSVLKQIPVAQWGTKTGLVQEVYYEGESYRANRPEFLRILAGLLKAGAPSLRWSCVSGAGVRLLPSGLSIGQHADMWLWPWIRQGVDPKVHLPTAVPHKVTRLSSTILRTRRRARCGVTCRGGGDSRSFVAGVAARS